MAGVVTVRLPDGSTRELVEGTTAFHLAESIGPRLAKAAVAATVDGTEVDLSAEIPDGSTVSVVTAESDAGRNVIRHSTAHVLAQAVLRLWPGAYFAIGPVIEDGFYYDFELPGGAHFSDDDLGRIEATMREIMNEDQPFVRHEHSIQEGLTLFEDQPFKREIIEAVGVGANEIDAAPGDEGAPEVSTYWNSPVFADLCRGPHVPSTGRVGLLYPDAGGGSVLAGRREAPTAAADLRNRVGIGEGAGCISSSPERGGTTRPPKTRS
jgi:threonyl-tRNA synthetase